MKSRPVLLGLCILLSPVAVTCLAVEEGGHIEHAGISERDVAAAQRGARIFVNYCLSCHSAQYMRYNRLAEDLDLTEEQVMKNLIFADAKIGDTMDVAMRPEQATDWLGTVPPDLSLIARSRGVDWLFTYLKSFYRDSSGNWNNLALPNASMPHVLWQLQGIQVPVYATREHEEYIERLELETPGLLTPEQYEEAVRDLVTFLDYMSEPAKLKRKQIGIWVMLFLVVFAFITYLLKAEYWRDIH